MFLGHLRLFYVIWVLSDTIFNFKLIYKAGDAFCKWNYLCRVLQPSVITNAYLLFLWHDGLYSTIKQELAELKQVETRMNRMTELRNELQTILTEEKRESVSRAPPLKWSIYVLYNLRILKCTKL